MSLRLDADHVHGAGPQVRVDHVVDVSEVAVEAGAVVDDIDVGPAAFDQPARTTAAWSSSTSSR